MTREEVTSEFEDLEALRVRFEEFRSGHARRTRLPEELWQAAVEMAGRRGVNGVARCLRLDAHSLKKRMEPGVADTGRRRKAAKASPQSSAQFIEFVTPAMPSGCVLEVESAQSGKLRIEWRGVSASDVTQLIRGFVGR